MSVRLRTLKDGTPYWQVRFRENGKESSVSWDDPAEAEQFDKLVLKVGAAKARDICRIVASPAHALTVTGWLTQHNDTITGIDAGTRTRYRAYLKNDIAPTLGDIPLTALTRDDIQRWVNRMDITDEDGNRPSGKTIGNKHGYLAGALNAAIIAKKVKANPCDGIKLPPWDREENVFLEHDEFQILFANVPEYWRPLVEFLVATGCRWSEATALRPGDVNRAAGTVRITRAWKTGAGGYRLGVTKTKMSKRTVNVPKRVLDKLDYTGQWLFTNSGRGKGKFSDGIIRDDGGPVRIHNFHPNVWKPALDRAVVAGLTKTPRVHDLRHTCASWLIQAGRPLPAVQAQLGHESINTTISIYTHLDRSSGTGNADAIDAALTR